MSAYWPPLENLPTFDVLVFRNAQDVVDYAVATNTANNIAGGTAGDLLYQSAPSTTAKLPIGANTYVLTSNGTGPVWTAPPVIPSTPTLSQVLLAGNSAGATNIDMNTQNITNATAITATTFNGDLNGNANSATAVALTSDNTSTTCYIPFSKTTSPTSNTLFIDDITTLLRYKPDTGEVSAGRVTIGGILNPSAGDLATRLFQFTGAQPVFEIKNQATVGRIRLVTLDALNTEINVVTLSTSQFTTITTNNPTITGFTDPAASNSSSNIATTRWVQSAITAGGSATANNISGGIAGDLLYQSGPSTTAKLAIGANTYILTSNGTGPVWTAPPVIPSTPTLSAVLLAGNSAGATNIDMNLQNITNATAITATTFNGALNGNATTATTATTVTITDDNSGTTMYPIFTTATAGNKSLLFDSTTNPLRYLPDASVLSALKFAVGAFVDPIIGDNAGFISQNTGSNATVLQNQVTSGQIHLTVRNAINAASTVIISEVDVSAKQFTVGNIVTPVVGDNAGFIAQNTGANATVIQNQVTSGKIEFRTVTALNTLTIPLEISSTNFTTTTTNNPTITGFTDPIASNSSSNIATTRWVQSAITAGTSAVATQVTLSNTATGSTNYLVMSTTSSGTSSLLTDNSGATYDSTTNTAVINVQGNAGSSTLGNVSSTIPPDIYYIPVVSGTGNQQLRSDSLLSYEIISAGNVGEITANLNGNAGTSNQIQVNPDNTSTIHFITFAAGSGGGYKDLKMDSGLTPLRYKPDNGVLSSTYFAVGGIVDPVAGNNAGFLTQNIGSSATVVQNQATSGLVQLATRDAANNLQVSLQTSTTDTSIYSRNIRVGTVGTPCNFGYGASSVLSSLIITNSALAASVNYTTSQNTFIGMGVATSVTTASANNTYVGYGAGNLSTSGTQNVFVGTFAGAGNTTGSQNVFIGDQAGFQSTTTGTGSFNTCVGLGAGSVMTTTAAGNTLLGAGVATGITTGSLNTCVGINAGDNITTGSNNICIGNNSAVPTATASNQIAIGTASETLYVRGGFNWRIGSQITSTATGNLAAVVLAQFYTVAMSSAGQTITLPGPATAGYLGARVTFKRKTNTTAFTLAAGAGTPFIPIAAVAASATITVSSSIFQVDLVCDGGNWCVIGQA
jgi:hypothetical protein